MAVKQYVGARYVPKFATPIEWQANTSYDALTIVSYNNASYTSKVTVPPTVGIPTENSDYWVLTGNYNAQVEQYRQDIVSYKEDTDTQLGEMNTKVDTITDKVDTLETTTSEQGGKISTLETTTSEQGGKISTLETTTSEQGGKISTLETTTSEQGGKISTLETTTSEQGGKISTLETTTSEQGGKISTLESNLNIVNSNITSIRNSVTLLSGRTPEHFQLNNFVTFDVGTRGTPSSKLDGIIIPSSMYGAEYFIGFLNIAVIGSQEGTKGNSYKICTLPSQINFNGKNYNVDYSLLNLNVPQYSFDTKLGLLNYSSSDKSINFLSNEDTFNTGGVWKIAVQLTFS